jgi:hypothetical protein
VEALYAMVPMLNILLMEKPGIVLELMDKELIGIIKITLAIDYGVLKITPAGM